jgi:hypothetical protein
MIVNANSGSCTYTSAANEFNPLLAVDNCPGFTLTHQINSDPFVSGVQFQQEQYSTAGVNTITYRLTDGVNTVTCSFTVTVLDTQAPVINCPSTVIAM